MKTELFSSALLFSFLLQMLCLFMLLCTNFWPVCCPSAAGTQTFQKAASTNKMYKVLMLNGSYQILFLCSAVQGSNIRYVLWFLEAVRKTVVQPFYSVAVSWFCSESRVGNFLEICEVSGGDRDSASAESWGAGCWGTSSCGQRMEPEEPWAGRSGIGKGGDVPNWGLTEERAGEGWCWRKQLGGAGMCWGAARGRISELKDDEGSGTGGITVSVGHSSIWTVCLVWGAAVYV